MTSNHHQLKEGTQVMVTKGDLKGSRGVIARIYPLEGVASLRFTPSQCTDVRVRENTAPDGFVHWLSRFDEIEPVNQTLHFT